MGKAIASGCEWSCAYCMPCATRDATGENSLAYTCRSIAVLNVKSGVSQLLLFASDYQIAVIIKPLYLTHTTCCLTFNTTSRISSRLVLETFTCTFTSCSLWELPYRCCLHGDFCKFVWWRAIKQYFHHRDHYGSATLRFDMGPTILEHLLRP